MSRTTIRMRVLPRFPARISGTNGIVSLRDGADVVVKNDFSDMIRIPGVDNQAKTFFLSWNADLDLYSILSFADLFSAIPGVTGFMTTSVYDPQSRSADIFAALDSQNARITWEKIGDYTLTNATIFDIPNLSNYRDLRMSAEITLTVSTNVFMRFSSNNGASFDTASSYQYAGLVGSGSTASAGGTTATSVPIFSLGPDNGSMSSFSLIIKALNKNRRTSLVCNSEGISSSVMFTSQIGAQHFTAVDNALRLFVTTGSMTGTVTLEGVRG